ncbi:MULTISPECIES: hypothetical protein [unclassified Bartonella]|uniref:hypothetical protein n=1 Tax=unclassified Bartonella TaxID=2645622 RepID=UPI0035CEA015
MSKKSLLSCTTAAAILLFCTPHNLQAAEKFKAGKGEKKTATTGATYENLQALDSGKIYGTNLAIIGNKDTNNSTNPTMKFAVSAEKKGSYIELWNTTIKGTDFDIFRGLEAKNDAAIKMTGGSITAQAFAVSFFNSRPDYGNENMLENVTSSASKALEVRKNANVTVSGGSFNGQVSANGGGSITLTDDVKITSNKYGFFVEDPESWVQMIGGEVTGKGIAIVAQNNTRITLRDVIIKAGGSGTRVNALYSTITVSGNTEIKDASIGLEATGSNETGRGEIRVYGSKDTPIKITAKEIGLNAVRSGHIIVTDVLIKTDGNGMGAKAIDQNSMIELNGNTEIKDVAFGLVTEGSGEIKVTGSKDSPIKITGKEATMVAATWGRITVTNALLKTDGNGLAQVLIPKIV